MAANYNLYGRRTGPHTEGAQMNYDSQEHTYTVLIICAMRGYAPEEVELWIDENSEEYDADTASEYASISSLLSGFRYEVSK